MRGVRLRLGVLVVLVVLGVGDAEAVAVAGATEGLVLAMPGTKTAMNLVGRVIEHVYPANGIVAGGSTLDPSLSPDGKKSSVTALGGPKRASREELVVDRSRFRCFNRGEANRGSGDDENANGRVGSFEAKTDPNQLGGRLGVK